MGVHDGVGLNSTEPNQTDNPRLCHPAPSAPGRNVAIRDGAETELPDKVTLELRKHDVISVQTPGGGAWGNSVSK